jgi:hypothetical protein
LLLVWRPDPLAAATGVIGGATALIAAPALGAREEGAIGFLKGLGAGTASRERCARAGAPR